MTIESDNPDMESSIQTDVNWYRNIFRIGDSDLDGPGEPSSLVKNSGSGFQSWLYSTMGIGEKPEVQLFGPNLVKNGSFEDTGKTFELDEGQKGKIAYTTVDNWENAGPSSVLEVWHKYNRGKNSVDGSNYISLDYKGGLDSLVQDISTDENQEYQLTFSARQRSDKWQNSEKMEVWFGGKLIATVEPELNVWTEYTFTVVGSGQDKLEFRELESQNNWDPTVMIDDVSLYGIGEPVGPVASDMQSVANRTSATLFGRYNVDETATMRDTLFGAQDGSDTENTK